MGMYTEIYVKVRIKEGVPGEVINLLKYMTGDGAEPKPTPQHKLFSTHRWDFMFQCCSYYHILGVAGKLWFDDIANQWFMVWRSDLKNYDNEISLFFDWITPYVETNCGEKTFIGYELYEEDNEPKLYYI